MVFVRFRFMERTVKFKYRMGTVASLSGSKSQRKTVHNVKRSFRTTVTSSESCSVASTVTSTTTSTTVTSKRRVCSRVSSSPRISLDSPSSSWELPLSRISSPTTDASVVTAMNGHKETSPAMKLGDHSTQASGNGGNLISAQRPDDDIVVVYDAKTDWIDLCDSDLDDSHTQENLPAFKSRAHEVDSRLGMKKQKTTHSFQTKTLQNSVSNNTAKIHISKPVPKRFYERTCICGKTLYVKGEAGTHFYAIDNPDAMKVTEDMSPEQRKKTEEIIAQVRAKQIACLQRNLFIFIHDTYHDTLIHYHQIEKDYHCPRCGYSCLSYWSLDRHTKASCDKKLNYMKSCYVRL